MLGEAAAFGSTFWASVSLAYGLTTTSLDAGATVDDDTRDVIFIARRIKLVAMVLGEENGKIQTQKHSSKESKQKYFNI